MNNAAIGARYAQEKYGINRVAVLDFDVHHGNGKKTL
jgi:acetoin utilization deacetylase AcuC-like enzyme